MQVLPRYGQIIQYYTELIDTGKLREGDKIPTEEEICVLFNVSRITVRKALDTLSQQGYINKLHGKGSFVSRKKTDLQLNHLVGFSEEMRQLGMVPSTRLISQQIISPPDLAAGALNISAGQKVYYFERLRYANDIPMAIERVHLPFHRFPGLENYDLSGSLYGLLDERFGCKISHGQQSISAGLAPDSDCRLLDLAPNTPVLQISRTTYETNGLPFEYVRSTYRGDRYVFNATLGKV